MFDRTMPQYMDCFYKSPLVTLPRASIAHRYRIAMEARGAVGNKAEKLLQGVVREFASL